MNLFFNDISKDLEEDINGELFEIFINFEVLDLFFNKILFLLKLFLKKIKYLCCFNISNNRIFSWMVDMSIVLKFKLLDFFDNKLKIFDEGVFI